MQWSTRALVLLSACLLVSAPQARGQAFASAGGGGTGAVAGAGNGVFGGLFPFFFPFSPPCAAVITINPWVPATTIPAPPPGLLTFVNNVAVFSDVSLCPGGKLSFQWTGNHSVVQLASGICPSAATPPAAMKQLVPAAVNGTASLSFATPGTYWLTSTVGMDCSQGQLLKVVVPNTGAIIPTPLPATPVATPPVATPPITTPPPLAAGGPGPNAVALGTPGGTSTSTSNNSAASASGPPGTAQTATGNGTAFSSSGNPAALAPALGLLNSIGRRMQQTPIGNTAASFNPSGPNNCTEQRLTPNGMGGGAFSQGACNQTATSLTPAGDAAAAGNGGTALTAPGASFSHTPNGRRMLRGHQDET